MELPIFQAGHENLSFSFKDWDMETEELLSELQEKSKNVGAFVRQMMGLLLEDFCGKPWESYKDAEKILKKSVSSAIKFIEKNQGEGSFARSS